MFDDQFGGGGFSGYTPPPAHYAPPEPDHYAHDHYEPEPIYEEPVYHAPEPHYDPLAFVPPIAGQGVIFDVTADNAGYGFAELARVEAEASLEQANSLAEAFASESAIPDFVPLYLQDPHTSTQRYTNTTTRGEQRSEPAVQALGSCSRGPIPEPDRALRERLNKFRLERGGDETFDERNPYPKSVVWCTDYARALLSFMGEEQPNGWYKPTPFEWNGMTFKELLRLRGIEFAYLRRMHRRNPQSWYGDARLKGSIICDAFMKQVLKDFRYAGEPRADSTWIRPSRDEADKFFDGQHKNLYKAFRVHQNLLTEFMPVDY